MPTVKERLRRATALSAPSLAMARRRRSGRIDLFFVSFIRFHKIDLIRLKVHFMRPKERDIPEFRNFGCNSLFFLLVFLSTSQATLDVTDRPLRWYNGPVWKAIWLKRIIRWNPPLS